MPWYLFFSFTTYRAELSTEVQKNKLDKFQRQNAANQYISCVLWVSASSTSKLLIINIFWNISSFFKTAASVSQWDQNSKGLGGYCILQTTIKILKHKHKVLMHLYKCIDALLLDYNTSFTYTRNIYKALKAGIQKGPAIGWFLQEIATVNLLGKDKQYKFPSKKSMP